MPKTREQKREEAQARAALRAQRSEEDQLAKLEGTRGASKKERAKLLHRIEQRGKVTKRKKEKKK